MQSSQNVAIVKIPFRLRAMTFSNYRLLFLFPWERGFAIATVVLNWQETAVVLGIHRCYTMSKRSLVRKYTH